MQIHSRYALISLDRVKRADNIDDAIFGAFRGITLLVVCKLSVIQTRMFYSSGQSVISIKDFSHKKTTQIQSVIPKPPESLRLELNGLQEPPCQVTRSLTQWSYRFEILEFRPTINWHKSEVKHKGPDHVIFSDLVLQPTREPLVFI